ncbi:hypothetical protein D3C77_569810 [compost metagenome]
MQPHHLAKPIANFKQARIPKLQVVVHERRDGGALVGEAPRHHVAPCHQDGPVVGVGPGHLGQPLALDGWLVILAVGVIEHPGVIGHPGRGVDGLWHAEGHGATVG